MFVGSVCRRVGLGGGGGGGEGLVLRGRGWHWRRDNFVYASHSPPPPPPPPPAAPTPTHTLCPCPATATPWPPVAHPPSLPPPWPGLCADSSPPTHRAVAVVPTGTGTKPQRGRAMTTGMLGCHPRASARRLGGRSSDHPATPTTPTRGPCSWCGPGLALPPAPGAWPRRSAPGLPMGPTHGRGRGLGPLGRARTPGEDLSTWALAWTGTCQTCPRHRRTPCPLPRPYWARALACCQPYPRSWAMSRGPALPLWPPTAVSLPGWCFPHRHHRPLP